MLQQHGAWFGSCQTPPCSVARHVGSASFARGTRLGVLHSAGLHTSQGACGLVGSDTAVSNGDVEVVAELLRGCSRTVVSVDTDSHIDAGMCSEGVLHVDAALSVSSDRSERVRSGLCVSNVRSQHVKR